MDEGVRMGRLMPVSSGCPSLPLNPQALLRPVWVLWAGMDEGAGTSGGCGVKTVEGLEPLGEVVASHKVGKMRAIITVVVRTPQPTL